MTETKTNLRASLVRVDPIAAPMKKSPSIRYFLNGGRSTYHKYLVLRFTRCFTSDPFFLSGAELKADWVA